MNRLAVLVSGETGLRTFLKQPRECFEDGTSATSGCGLQIRGAVHPTSFMPFYGEIDGWVMVGSKQHVKKLSAAGQF